MSEKSKGDTSSLRVVKNPLLSASVTGLTFDDFSCTPLLLPAAPPIERTPLPAPVLDINVPAKEPSPVPNFDIDSDAFSEINLNATVDEDSVPGSTGFLSPLEETQITSESSILSQAASSFSQLPSVASTVFSTFSKVIKDYSPTTGQTNDEREFSKPDLAPPVYEPFYAQQHQVESDINVGLIEPPPPAEPPKFYSPTEIPPNPLGTGPPAAANQNTYRLSAKKKIYAQIPGLASNSQQPHTANIVNEPVPSVSHNIPPLPVTSSTNYTNAPVQQIIPVAGPVFDLQAPSTEFNQLSEPPPPTESRKEERRGLFSLTNVVAPVWQNLSGLVGKSNIQEGQPISTPFSEQHSFVGQSYDNSGLTNIQATNSSPFNQPPPPAQYYPTSTSTQFVNLPQSIPNLQPTPPLPSISPVVQPPSLIPNQQASSTLQQQPVLSQSAAPPLQQIPPSGLNNNFRLQKGTRHYRSSLQQSANQSLPSNFQAPIQQPLIPFIPETSSLSQQTPQPTPIAPVFNPITIATISQPIPFTPFAQIESQEKPESNVISFQHSDPFQSVPLFSPASQGNSHDAAAANTSNIGNVATPISLFNPVTTIPTQTEQTGPPGVPLFSNTTNQGQLTSSVPLFNALDTTPSTPSLQSFYSAPKEDIKPSKEHFQDHVDQGLFTPPTSCPQIGFYNPVAENPVSSTFFGQEKISSVDKIQEEFREPQASEVFQSVPLFAPVTQNYADCVDIKKEETKPEPSAPKFDDIDVTDPGRSNISTPFSDSIPIFSPAPPPAPIFPTTVELPQTLTTNTFSSNTPNIPIFAPIPTPFELSNPQLPPSTSLFPTTVDSPPSLITDPFSSNRTNIPIFAPIPTPIQQPQAQQQINFIPPAEPVHAKLIDDSKPPQFTLTNYFASQTTDQIGSSFTPLDPDFNANKTLSQQIVNKPAEIRQHQTEITNFFAPTTNQNVDTQNNLVPTFAANLPDPLSFFDSFHQAPPTLTNRSLLDQDNNSNSYDTKTEDESNFQIQNFFNNPPQNLNQSASELNYNLVGSNFINKNFRESLSASRAISPQSNVVEPPSSACSELSTELTSQNPLNLSKLTNDDIPEDLKTEYFLDQDIMAAIISSKANPNTNVVYRPAVKHWFYKKKVDDKFIWKPFSYHDSALIEEHFSNEDAPKTVDVEGGRYGVNIEERTRLPIFWSGDASEVRRCSWFYKAIDSRYVPYEEDIADKLESEYEDAAVTGEWHRKIALATGETVVFHGPTVLVHFLQTQPSDSWGTSTQSTSRPRIVKRDLDDFHIEAGESNKVDHLLFMVHGIGSVCDLKFRTVEEVVDEFRNIGTQLIQSHYKQSCDTGRVGRVEVLPVSWHSELHSEESGIDEKLKAITLESIPKLRNFANDTLLDVLFYTSPVFCQNIMDIVAGTMNKVYSKYCQRNPSFNGGVSLAGHSLGSLILFDLLCHQKVIENADIQNSENPDQPIMPLQFCAQTATEATITTSKQISYTVGPAGTGQPFISYPQLVFQPKKFFALGSPVGMFVTIRGIDGLGLNFKLPTCPGYYNIFHPYDPVAYRIEALVNADLSSVRPVLIPHHKGRKRMHLELKETMTRVGADIKQRIFDTFKNTLDTVYQLTSKQKTDPDPTEIEREVDKVLEMQLKMDKEPRSRTNSTSTHSDIDTGETDIPLGSLNEARRIDYVLQEAPLEFFNEYLFALTSHVCYWESEDTILFIMKEIYSSLGAQTDSQIPQQTMTIERPNSNSFSLSDHPGPSRSSN